MTAKINLGSSLIALFLFFLPWIDIQCSGERVLTQTGLQVISGVSKSPNEKNMPRERATSSTHYKNNLGRSYIVGAAFIVVIFSVCVSLLILRNPKILSDKAVGVLCTAAFLLLLVQACIGFPVEQKLNESIEKHSSSSSGIIFELSDIEISYLTPLYIEFLALGLPALLLFSQLRKDKANKSLHPTASS